MHLAKHRPALPALGNDRARLCGAPIGQRNRPIRLPTLGLAQDRGGQIAQAAAQPQTAPRGPVEIGIRGILRSRGGVRQAMEGGSNGVGQFSAQTNTFVAAV
jgi:hypothetical protein